MISFVPLRQEDWMYTFKIIRRYSFDKKKEGKRQVKKHREARSLVHLSLSLSKSRERECDRYIGLKTQEYSCFCLHTPFHPSISCQKIYHSLTLTLSHFFHFPISSPLSSKRVLQCSTAAAAIPHLTGMLHFYLLRFSFPFLFH